MFERFLAENSEFLPSAKRALRAGYFNRFLRGLFAPTLALRGRERKIGAGFGKNRQKGARSGSFEQALRRQIRHRRFRGLNSPGTAVLTTSPPYYTILAPNGMKASFASLKHCSPNGTPIIVQHSIRPFAAAHTAKGRPPKIIQSIFAASEGAPPPYSTFFPNGASAREANLKHCRPIGMPIIVTHHKRPVTPHARACHIPPHNIHMMLPAQLI
jgi:hypothetical protein